MDDTPIALLAGLRGHFRMESGYHSDQWFDLDGLFADTDKLRPFVVELARRLAPHRIDAVCGPMTGGAQLAELIATEIDVENLLSERFEPQDPAGLFPVTYRLPEAQRAGVRGCRVGIVDDAISAGSAVRGTYADLLACGAQPVVLGALFVFGDAGALFAAENGLALEAIARVPLGMWKPDECPLCRAHVPLDPIPAS